MNTAVPILRLKRHRARFMTQFVIPSEARNPYRCQQSFQQ